MWCSLFSFRPRHAVHGLGVEAEQLGQRGRVGHGGLGVGELLDPDGGLVEELVGHPAHRLQHLGARRLVEGGEAGGEALHLGVHHVGRHRAQGHDGGGDAGLAAYGQERGDLLVVQLLERLERRVTVVDCALEEAAGV